MVRHGQLPELRAFSDGHQVALLRFSLDSIPPDSQVLTASLALYAPTRTLNADALLQVHEVTNPWDENSATWLESAQGVRWPGGEFGPPGLNTAQDPAASIRMHGVARWYTLDITELARKWVLLPEENHGVAIVVEAGARVAYVLGSSQSAGAARGLRPRLSVVYGDPYVSPTAMPTNTHEPTRTAISTPSPTAVPSVTPSPTAVRQCQFLPLIVRA